MCSRPCPCISLLSEDDVRKSAKHAAVSHRSCFACDATTTTTAPPPPKKGTKKPQQGKKSGAGKKKNNDPLKGENDDVEVVLRPIVEWCCLTCGTWTCGVHRAEHQHCVGRKAEKSKSAATCRSTHSVYFLEDREESPVFRLACSSCGVDTMLSCWETGDVDEDDDEATASPVQYIEGTPVDETGCSLLSQHKELARQLCSVFRSTLSHPGGDGSDTAARKQSEVSSSKKSSRKEGKEKKKSGVEKPTNSVASRAGVHGFPNAGNTCFFNAVLQCLLKLSSFTAPLVQQFLQKETIGPLHGAIAMLAQALQEGTTASSVKVGLRAVFARLCDRNEMFGDREQHDAHELWLCLLASLEDEWTVRYGHLASAGSDKNVLAMSLKGKSENVIVCASCGHQTKVTESFFNWSASLTSSKKASGASSSSSSSSPAGVMQKEIADCLRETLEPQPLADGDRFACERCHRAEAEQRRSREEAERRDRLEALRLQMEQFTAREIMDGDDEDASSSSESSEDDDEDDKTAAVPPPQPVTATTPVNDETLPGAQVEMDSGGGASPIPTNAEEQQQQQGSSITTKIQQLNTALVVHVLRFRFHVPTLQWVKDRRFLRLAKELDPLTLFFPDDAVRAVMREREEQAKAFQRFAKRCPKLSPAVRCNILFDICAGDVDMAISIALEGVLLDSSSSSTSGEDMEELTERLRLLNDPYFGTALSRDVLTSESARAAQLGIKQLVGVVCHEGSLEGGHYTAYVKDRPTNQWFYCNDASVQAVGEETVLARGDAYLVFYES